jgi:hypothetical protein
MDLKTEKVGEVNGKPVFYLASPLHNQVEAFMAEGIPAPYIVLPEQAVEIRLDSDFEKNNYGTRTSLTPLAVKGEIPFYTKVHLGWLLLRW